MKVKYEYVNGETNEIEVDEELGTILASLDRQEYNNHKRETRRHCAIEGLMWRLSDEKVNIEADCTSENFIEAILAPLNTEQREIFNSVFFNGYSLKEVAKRYGTSYQAIQNRLNKILNKLRKSFNEGVV